MRLISPFVGGGFGGKLFVRADAILAALGARVARRPVKVALQRQSDRVLREVAAADAASREVTILGDRELPYRVLKKIMATCTDADYGKLSLAVIQKQDEVAQAGATTG